MRKKDTAGEQHLTDASCGGGCDLRHACLQVLEWQVEQRNEAERLGRVRTMLGRERCLPDAQKTASEHSRARGHALRAAINTPIQGSAADVATVAMLRISRHQRLRDLGWTMLLQVGPDCTAQGAAGLAC